MSSECFVIEDSDDELHEINQTPDSSLKNRDLKSLSMKEQNNGLGVSVISCPMGGSVISCLMGGCNMKTNTEMSMREHMEFDHAEDETGGMKGSEEDGPLRGLSFNLQESKQDQELKGNKKGVGVSVITCPMECGVEKNDAQSMTAHIELYHFGEENKREETMDVEIQSKKVNGKGKFTKQSNHDKHVSNVYGGKEKKRHGGRVSNVPKAEDMVRYKGCDVKYWLVQLSGMVETAEKNLFDIEKGITKVKWSKSLYYEWLTNEIPDSKTWTKETLKRRTAEIEENSDKFIMSKKEGKKTGMGDYDNEMDPQLRPDRKETFVEPKTEEEKTIASLRMKFNGLKKAIDQKKFAKPKAYVDPKLAAKANDVNNLFQVDERECGRTPKINRRLPSTLQGKDENLYEKARNIRDVSVQKEPRTSKRNIQEEDVETKVGRLVDTLNDRLQTQQPANVHPGVPQLAYPYPGMLGPPGGYFHNIVPGMNMTQMGVALTMNPRMQNATSVGEGSSAPIAKAGDPVVKPMGAGWPVTGGQMYSPVPGWQMGMPTANFNMAPSSETSQVQPMTIAPAGWQMPNVCGPAWYGFPGYTCNPPGPSAMSSTSSTEVPPVSTPGVIVNPSSVPGPSAMSSTSSTEVPPVSTPGVIVSPSSVPGPSVMSPSKDRLFHSSI